MKFDIQKRIVYQLDQQETTTRNLANQNFSDDPKFIANKSA